VKSNELIRLLKGFASDAEVCIDDGGGGLLPITGPRIATAREKAEAGRDPGEIVVVLPAKSGLEQPQ
jgi:hypothetical protein